MSRAPPHVPPVMGVISEDGGGAGGSPGAQAETAGGAGGDWGAEQGWTPAHHRPLCLGPGPTSLTLGRRPDWGHLGSSGSPAPGRSLGCRPGCPAVRGAPGNPTAGASRGRRTGARCGAHGSPTPAAQLLTPVSAAVPPQPFTRSRRSLSTSCAPGLGPPSGGSRTSVPGCGGLPGGGVPAPGEACPHISGALHPRKGAPRVR